jgi:ABC-type transport system involved in multi-copper enzyme maturation permease subunit
MQTTSNPPRPATLPNLAGSTPRPNPLGNVLAVASIVIKELTRRKDFYVLFVLTALITLVLGSARFFNQENAFRYLKEVCLFLIWVSSLVIAVATTARQVSTERENRTLFPLLAKPITRRDFILGKFAGCWLATGLALTVFYLFFGVVSGLREHDWPVLHYVQALFLHWMMLGVVCALTLLASLVLAAPSSTNTIVLVVTTGILLVGRHLNKVAVTLDEPLRSVVYGIYFAMPHLEFFDLRDLLIHGWSLVRWSIIGCAALYAVVYMTIFLSTACLAFQRKAVQ